MKGWERVIDFLRQRKVILAAFVLSACAQSLEYYFEGNEISQLGLLAFPVLAWFANKRYGLATTAIILLLLILGSGFLYDSLNALTGRDGSFSWLIPVKVVVGVYLTWGALLLHRERRGIG